MQQTKRGSRASGGPQYYFHNLTDAVKVYLRKKGAVRVALVTPYGATKSDYFAVSKEHKLDSTLRPVAGNVGHDRIQQGLAGESIGEAIRFWYQLPKGDFEKIGIEIEIIDDVFYLTPHSYKYASAVKEREIPRVERPLTFTRDYASQLWVKQLTHIKKSQAELLVWSLEEICRVVKDHRPETKLAHIQETDILRASGPLKHLGMTLGGYVGKGYDCLTEFSFLQYPTYSVPVEVKKNSRGFEYQQKKYGKEMLSRAVVLCAIHDHTNVPRNIDVIELEALCQYANKLHL
ncbi:MAG: hypothetical protein ACRD82_09200 [Blastocatellia bacterium]